MDNGRICKQIFEWNMQFLLNNSWESNLLSVLNEINMQKYFIDVEHINTNDVSEKIMLHIHEKWQHDVVLKPKLRTYNLFKCDTNTESYILCNLNKPKRSLLAQLRLGILHLEVETGRYLNVPLENRICKLCNNQVEDEIHFSCVCTRLQHIRSGIFYTLNVNTDLNVIDQFIYIMTHPNVKTVANYIFDIWNFRNSVLFN